MPFHSFSRLRLIAAAGLLGFALGGTASATEPPTVWGEAGRIGLDEFDGLTEWASASTAMPPTVILRPGPGQLWVVFSAASSDLRSGSEEIDRRWRIAFETAQGIVVAERVGGSAGVDGAAAIESTVYAPPADTPAHSVRAVLVQAPADSAVVREYEARTARYAAQQARIAALSAEAPLQRAQPGQGFAFDLDSLDHGRLRSAAFRGRPVLIEFWATWCAPCAASARELAALQARVGADRLAVIGISVDRDADAVREFVRQHGADWPQHVVGDEDRGLALLQQVFGVQAVPQYLLLDADGVVRHIGSGPVAAQDFERRLQALATP